MTVNITLECDATVSQRITNILEEPAASIFTSLFYNESESSRVLQNVRNLPNYLACIPENCDF
jgi:hypothetical protein